MNEMVGGVHWERLKPGDLVAVLTSACAPDSPVAYDGTPYRLKAVSYPFAVALSQCGQSVSFDLRVCRFTRVSRRYARAFANTPSRRRRRKEREDGHVRCVRCGERCRQRQKMDTRQWVWFCPECDAEMGEVTK